MRKIYNIFISHSWSYPGDYDRLKDLLNNNPYFEFIDYSIPKAASIHHLSNDNALYQAIYHKMHPCHVVLIMAGLYSIHDRWIDKEIEIAKSEFSMPKPILVIKPHTNANVSSVVAENADAIVEYDAEAIVGAIKRLVP